LPGEKGIRLYLIMDHSITDQTFEKKDLTEHPLKKGEYENCIFRHCNLSGADLAEMVFIDCSFISCNLSLARLTKTVLRDATFKDCKMLGLHFEDCNEFGLSFNIEGCILDQTSFYRAKLKKTIFKNSQFKEADLTECDLTEAVFDNCDLSKTIFDNTVLEKADLRTAYNYSIDPDRNRVKKARFSSAGLAGLLDKYNLQID
jgi:uncharacterized protein YjbI with pentapeptide repeats